MASLASTLYKIQFRTPLGGAYDAPPDPLVGWGGGNGKGVEGVGNGEGGIPSPFRSPSPFPTPFPNLFFQKLCVYLYTYLHK